MNNFKSGCGKIILLTAVIILLGALFGMGNEMGYCIVLYYGVFPICSFIWSFRLRAEGVKRRLAFIVLVALLGYAMPWVIFGKPWYLIAIIGAVGSAGGAAFGIIEYSAEKKLESEDKDSSD